MACGCGCGGDVCTRGVALAGLQNLGLHGQSVFGYQAYATAADGTGFSLTYTGVQTYRAILLSNVIIPTPVQGNFTGLWQRWTGPDGISGAVTRNWKFSNNTAATDPGSTYVKLNNADLTLATAIYISETDNSSISVAALIALVAASSSTVKGYIQITKKGDNSKFAVYSVTGLTDNGPWDTLAVTYVNGSGAGPFVLDDEVVVGFMRNGDKGTTGVVVIEDDLTQAKQSTTAGPDLITFEIPANTLVNNGDYCETDVDIIQGIAWMSGDYQGLLMEDNNDPGSQFFLVPQPSFGFYRLRYTISRITATTYWATQEMIDHNNNPTFMWGIHFTGAGFDFTTDIYIMRLVVRNTVVSGAAAPFATVARCLTKYYPKP